MVFKGFLLTMFFMYFSERMAKNMGLLNIFRKRVVNKGVIPETNLCITGLNNSENQSECKKIITLSPGGVKGFYVMGLCKYIKTNYDLSNYVFSGASAGSWNSLVLCHKGSITDMENEILDSIPESSSTLRDLEMQLKSKILEKYKTEDFELDRLFVGTTVFEKFKFKTVVYSNFSSLEDAVDCCVASSHIPFITGGFKSKYKGLATFDGGFSEFPYLNNNISSIHLTPSIWKSDLRTYENITTKIKTKNTIKTLLKMGYDDAVENKYILDKMFGDDFNNENSDESSDENIIK